MADDEHGKESCIPLERHFKAILDEHEKRWQDFHGRIQRLEEKDVVTRPEFSEDSRRIQVLERNSPTRFELISVVTVAMTIAGLVITIVGLLIRHG